MVTSRRLEDADRELLTKSIDGDPWHQDVELLAFNDSRTLTNVYELEGKPVAFVRASKSLRISTQFVNNEDRKRNAVVIYRGIQKLVETAQQNGFTEILFNSDNQELIDFVKNKLGFQAVNGEVRLLI